MASKPWTCDHCRAEQTHDTICQDCHTPRYPTWAIMVASHVLEHIADGIIEPLPILEAMSARPCYKNTQFTLNFIGQQLRLLTKDTTQAARALVKARSARTMLEVLETGDSKDKIAVLAKWGPETNAEHVDHKVDAVTTHVVELHDGPPPKRATGPDVGSDVPGGGAA